MNARIVGFASQKLSPDSGSGISPLITCYLDRGFGAGGEWKYTNIKHKLAFDVRFQQQFGSSSGPPARSLFSASPTSIFCRRNRRNRTNLNETNLNEK